MKYHSTGFSILIYPSPANVLNDSNGAGSRRARAMSAFVCEWGCSRSEIGK